MSLLPRLRLALARRPWLYWLLVCVCGATVWLGLAAAHTRADRARTQWGTTRSVWVARTAIAAGDPLLATAEDRHVITGRQQRGPVAGHGEHQPVGG